MSVDLGVSGAGEETDGGGADTGPRQFGTERGHLLFRDAALHRPALGVVTSLAPGNKELDMYWLGDLDSNQGFPSQSRKFYR